MKNKKAKIKGSSNFINSALLNDETYFDYMQRFKKIATSMFEWVNLPPTMNARALEESLFYYGTCAFLKHEKFGFINTKATSDGNVNIYGLPTQVNCNAFSFSEMRPLYNALIPNEKQCVLVMNTWDRIPTVSTLELFCIRLTEAQRSADTNIKAQKTPVLIVVDEQQRLTMENLYSKYDGNEPVIFGDKSQISDAPIRAIGTGAPFVADKITEYKKEIWNEALTYLGINNIDINKKERLISGEATSNNELINLNLQAFLIPRQEACKQFNELFGLTGTDKEISVRVRSDLYNVIKQENSIVADYNKNGIPDDMEGSEQ